MQQAEMDFFFAGKPMEAALYRRLLERMFSELPSFEIKVQKTQITFINPRVFACVSLKWKNTLTVTFGLPSKAESPRIFAASEPYPNRWTHHVKIKTPEEIDEELMEWLKSAHAFSQNNA